MATFYILPPRAVVARRITEYVSSLLPEMNWEPAESLELTEKIVELAEDRCGVFVVFREDLMGAEDVAGTLTEGFGAAAGDLVVEISDGSVRASARMWRVPAARAA